MNTLDELKEKLTTLLPGQAVQCDESIVKKLLHAERVPFNVYPSADYMFQEWLAEQSILLFYDAIGARVVFEKRA